MPRRTTRWIAALLLAGFLLTVLVSAVQAGARHASDVELRTMSVGSLARRSAPLSRALPIRADLLGASWRGSAHAIEVRVQGPDGRWSRWVELHATEDAPDPRSAEARGGVRRAHGRTVSAPIWVGAAERVQLRDVASPAVSRTNTRDVQLIAINASGTASRSERFATRARRSAAWVLGEQAHAQPLAPGIRSRASWGAVAPRVDPAVASGGVRGMVVHHTAGTNRYSCAQVPAILRGIQRYHMQSNGWNDIGYNYLVDRCGGVWEGRAGGLTQAVIGAHTAGFNTGTSGVALIGKHASVRSSAAARNSLRRLIAWRLDVAHVRPTGTMQLTAATGGKFQAGSAVRVRAVSGHRDLFATSCPGAVAAAELNALARTAWATGGAKIADVTRTFTLRAPEDPLNASLQQVVIRAAASHADMALAARIERISTGETIAQVLVNGRALTWTWNVPPAVQLASWDARVVISGQRAGGQRARAASYALDPVSPDPGFVVTTAPATRVAPGADPVDDDVQLQYTLGLDYRLGAWLIDPTSGAQIAVLREPAYLGPQLTPVLLHLAIPAQVAAGTYELRVGLVADPARGRSMRRYPLTVERA